MAKRKQASRRRVKAKPQKKDTRRVPPVADSFPIVGVGASAGGLEALERLLKTLPGNTGMAFVLVQHLDPKHKSLLTQILSRASSMTVAEVRDGVEVQPNHVYIIPANTNMFLKNGALRLEPRAPEMLYMPVDFLFRSLAKVQKNRAIGVVLSGTASDGAAGIKAIKEEGGITFAQNSATAKYFGMPHSSIVTGMVDFVLSPEEIAKRLVRIGQHPYLSVAGLLDESQPEPSGEQADPLKQIFDLIKKNAL